MSSLGAFIMNDPSYKLFAWWTAVLILKILLMVPLIGKHRFTKRIFLSPEDTLLIPGAKVSTTDPDIERVRRAHLNDLESILPWVISTALWLTTLPDPACAAFLIKTFGICRLIHTFVYAVCPLPQPARFLAFASSIIIIHASDNTKGSYRLRQFKSWQNIVDSRRIAGEVEYRISLPMFLYDGTQTSQEFTVLYSWWASLLVIQLLSVTWVTGQVRVRTETIHSDEDRMWLKNRNVQLHASGGGHPDVERIRSGHWNDVSIIIPYLMIALLWMDTSPSGISTNFVLRAFPIAKMADAALYLKLVNASDTCRQFCLAICYSIVLYMIVSCLLYSYS